MSEPNKPTRRTVLKTGIIAAAAAAAPTGPAQAIMPEELARKAPGETRVFFLGGDELHNFLDQEPPLRNIMERAGWKFYSTHDARFVTPALLRTVDLLLIQRWVGSLPGWLPGPIYGAHAPLDGYMNDELEDAIVDNVRNRGMGYISIHCAIWAHERYKYLDLLGVRQIIHGPLQPIRIHNLNQDHPITRGMKEFDLPLDENFGAELVNPRVVPLYESTGYIDKRHDYGGWCIEQDKGRVVGLLAGHTYFAYRDPNYLRLFRNAAHWAMKKDIPQG